MPRPVSDAVADGLPLWDTYEALFFLTTGIFLGLVFGFLFPSLWRSFRRRFRRVDKYRGESGAVSGPLKVFSENQLLSLNTEEEPSQQGQDLDLVTAFVAARYAVQENAHRDAATLYLQILGSEKVSRAQTNKAIFELAQVYSLSGLTERALETGLELLHRKPANTEVFKFLLGLCAAHPDYKLLADIVDTYSGPNSVDLSREVAHLLSTAAQTLLRSDKQVDAVQLAKRAVRWSPSSLEPKLVLVEATSVQSQRDAQRPLDQSVLGFIVDFAELLRLIRQHPNRSPFMNLPLFTAWSKFFDGQDKQAADIFSRLRNECLAQLNWDAQEKDPTFRHDVSFLLGALVHVGARQGVRAQWESALLGLFPLDTMPSNLSTVFVCPSCSELHSRFRWRCSTCQRWDTLAPWSPSTQNP